MAKFSKGEKVDVKYSDNCRYPAIIVDLIPHGPDDDPEDGDEYEIRWDPPDPNLPPTWLAHENAIRRLK